MKMAVEEVRRTVCIMDGKEQMEKDFGNWVMVPHALKVLHKPVQDFVLKQIGNFQKDLISHQKELSSPRSVPSCTNGHHQNILWDKDSERYYFKEPCKQQPGCRIALWLKALGENNKNHRIDSKNFEAERWPCDPLEVAKFFMPGGQTKGGRKKTKEETDIAAYLNVILNCQYFHQKEGEQKAHKYDGRAMELVRQVINVRNALFHDGKIGLTDETRANYFGDLKKFVDGFPDIFPDPIEISDQLTKIQSQMIRLLDADDITAELLATLQAALCKRYINQSRGENDDSVGFQLLAQEGDVCRLSDVYLEPELQVQTKDSRTDRRLVQLAGCNRLADIRIRRRPCGVLHNILEPFTVEGSGDRKSVEPKRILVEGQSGMGKSTGGFKLVNDWASDQRQLLLEKTETLYQFDLVFILKASSFEEAGDVYEVISGVLGGEWATRSEVVKRCIESDQVKTLYIVDGFDEAIGNEPALAKLMSQSNPSTVVLTSRPGIVTEKLTGFDSIYAITGFSKEKQTQFIDRKTLDTSTKDNLKMLLDKNQTLRELCRNPMYLTILCMLPQESARPTTKTILYNRLENHMIGKTAQRKKLEVRDIKAVTSKIPEMAFRRLWEEKSLLLPVEKFSLDELPILKDLGFLSCETVGTNSICFNHKSFAEYSSARYLISLNDGVDRKSLLSEILVSEKGEDILSFAVGLLSMDTEKADQLKDLLEAWDEDHYPIVTFYTHTSDADSYIDIIKRFPIMCRKNHAHFHRILNWISEFDIDTLKQIPGLLESLILRIAATSRVFLLDQCSSECLRGLGKFGEAWSWCKQGTSSDLKQVDVYSTFYDQGTEKVLSDLQTSGCIDRVVLQMDWTNIASAVKQLHVGGKRSRFHKLVLYSLYCADPVIGDEIQFGPDLESLEVILGDQMSAECVTCLVSGIRIDGHLKKLHLVDCKIDHDCMRVVNRIAKIHSELESFALVPESPISSTDMRELLDSLAKLKSLKHLQLGDFDSSDKAILSDLRCSLDSLAIMRTRFDEGVIQRCLNHFSNLQVLKLEKNEQLGAVVQCIKQLSQLKMLSFDNTWLPDSEYRLLGRALADLVHLVELHVTITSQANLDELAGAFPANSQLSRMVILGMNLKDSISTGKLATAIAKLPSLLKLSIRQLKMDGQGHFEPLADAIAHHEKLAVVVIRKAHLTDAHLKMIQKMLHSNTNLQHFDLNINERGFSAKAWNDTCGNLRDKLGQRKLGYVDIYIGDSFLEKDIVYHDMRHNVHYLATF